jgi:hypothetical protein
MREPTFVIGGAQRCGTTTLYHLLDQHPQIYMARPVRPEPKFFVRAVLTLADREEYLRTWFAGADDERAVGEKSTSYLEVPGTARRMKDLFPRLRAIFLLRHPVERALSNYRFSRKHGLETEPFDVAVRDEAARLASQPAHGLSVHPFAYARRGCYIEDLQPYLREFRRDELLILLNDDLQSDPSRLCRSLYEFLGVDPDFSASDLGRRHNAEPDDGVRLDRETLDFLFEQFRASNARLAELLGRDLSLWDRPSKTIQRLLDA